MYYFVCPHLTLLLELLELYTKIKQFLTEYPPQDCHSISSLIYIVIYVRLNGRAHNEALTVGKECYCFEKYNGRGTKNR